MADRIHLPTLIIAPSIEQGLIAAAELGVPRARIVTTDRGRGLPDGIYPMPEEVRYAVGWERGHKADLVLAQLQRAYAKRLSPEGKVNLSKLISDELKDVSRSEARRLVQTGAVKVTGTYKDSPLTLEEVDPRHIAGRTIKVGKKRSFVVGKGALPSEAVKVGAAEDCKRCGRSNNIWFAPSPLWNAVIRGGSINGEPKFGDMVCASCFMQLAEQQGIATRFRVSAEEVMVELETTTPSGRVWDEANSRWQERNFVVGGGES